MLGRLLRRMDKLHLILILMCATLLTFLVNYGVKVNRSQGHSSLPIRWSSNASKPLVQYDSSVPLLWIGGVPRSGTTLMRAMVDAHPFIRCGEETRVIPRILGMHTKTYAEKTEMTRLQEAHIDRRLLNSAMASYILTIISGHGEAAPLLCNKDPFAIRSMPIILSMFPNSKFILMIRDGRSVAHSIITRHITIKGFDINNYDGSLKNWNQAITTMIQVCRSAGPDKCLPVYYERLVIDTKKQMERILEFVGVPWDDYVLHHEDLVKKGGIALSNREPSTNQVNKAVYKEALTKWHQAIPEYILRQVHIIAPMLHKLGYNVDKSPPDYSTDLDPVAERTLNIF